MTTAKRNNITKPRLQDDHFWGLCSRVGGEVVSGGSGEDDAVTGFSPACGKFEKRTLT